MSFKSRNLVKISISEEFSKFKAFFTSGSLNLKKKKDAIKLILKNKKPTIPSTIADEIKTNIFFRVNDPDVKKAINLENSPDIEIFTKLRDLKDNF